MAGPMTWELAEDAGEALGCVAVFTGHPDTLAKGSTEKVRLDLAPGYKRGNYAQRAFSWASYIFAAFFWMWRWPKDVPILLFSNPPILIWLGWLMKTLRGQQYAVMVHDIYPDILMRLSGVTERHFLIRLWLTLNRRAYESALVVMTLGEFMAANLEKRFDASKTLAGKVEVVYPWVDTEKIKLMPKEENWFAQKYDQVGKLTVMYSGNMGLGQNLEAMLETARLMQAEPKIHFMFIGAGPKWRLVEQAIRQHSLRNVTLLPWQPEEILPYSLACADVTLVSLESGMEGLAIPSKSIYALAAGSALIVLASGISELTNWVERFGFGYVVRSSNLMSIFRGMAETEGIDLSRHRNNANIAALRAFSRHQRSAQLIACVLNAFCGETGLPACE